MVETFDFGGLKKPGAGDKPHDPKEIFSRRPSGKSSIKELWQGQALALDEWAKHYDKNTIISMYTGAGKTLVGVLIAQSYVNRGYQNVLYACPTIDLIKQTLKEANSVGINPTTYYGSAFSDDKFEQGKSFCVTTYQALLPARTKFKGAKAPGAIIFDDAHVGERLVREAFTIVANKTYSPELFHSLAAEIRTIFDELNIAHNFDQAVNESSGGIALAPPVGVFKHSGRLQEILKNNISDNDTSNVLSLDYLRGRIGLCAITISRDRIEITPPFLPSLHMNILEDNAAPKVFLSATIQSKADVIRAFGRSSIPIEPPVDAGRGERVLLFGSSVSKFTNDTGNVRKLSQRHKVLIAVPSDKRALSWRTVVDQPSNDADFSARLNAFRAADSGAFILVGRYDGIDLPDDQCRIMVVDGLPVGITQLERYSFDTLRLDRAFLSTVASRITQLFGRINRGKNDFGLYIIPNREVENWIRNTRNISSFPRILQEQIRLSESFNEQIKDIQSEKVDALIDQIINRDENWISFYAAHIDNQNLDDKKIADRERENKLDDIYAKKESRFILKLWQSDFSGAIDEFRGDFSDISQINPRLHGWYSLWVGIAHLAIGEDDAMYDWFDEARKKLGGRLPLPRRPKPEGLESGLQDETTFLEEGLRQFLALDRPMLVKRIGKVAETVAMAFQQEDHKKAEEGIREFGSALGFDARRPCTDHGVGPDGIWIDHRAKKIIGIELKSDKQDSSEISKKDIGQSHNHVEWIRQEFPNYELVGLLIYTQATAISEKASPSDLMHICSFDSMRQLWREFSAIVGDLSALTPVERFINANRVGQEEKWSIEGILASLTK
ncbi:MULTISPECIES: DEAD/DEAH box helicase family protein [unclassified Mesorhizobium]|uniref:DEAD/DEAH box helicase family protein n=1 Tax=unclassified Mesorhizobium TaxID=325217 RepID=UPI00112E0871|nr:MULTISPECIES: DEAD/DEAH box helicase family protein [unclassified Mesorhizobium]TPK55245.1 DEAD/DEAH box helicase [Mesorhizobium sp. B2-5-2]TPL27810.1 DEAD/DEAH box helicase [Mesorhizobium sp. B2-4-7]TPL31638.1 DEAD/DEAH box helicase [Mesorhizobium sp. B2-4-9]TPL41761.1 DEAD/DEAH box helicase [Mesorhizobium sp. B2-4-5]TPM77790.1 DEAD/DEAH box helicase [Mesorhizobium sp. B2-1-6]